MLQYMPRYIAPLAVSSKKKAVVAQGVRISDEVLPFRSSALQSLMSVSASKA